MGGGVTGGRGEGEGMERGRVAAWELVGLPSKSTGTGGRPSPVPSPHLPCPALPRPALSSFPTRARRRRKVQEGCGGVWRSLGDAVRARPVADGVPAATQVPLRR